MFKLVEHVNLDNIQTISLNELESESPKVGGYMKELNMLCSDFLGKFKHVSFFKLQDEMIQDLRQVESSYSKLLTILASVDDNERLRVMIKDYPVLNVEKYKIPKFGKVKMVLWLVVFPLALIEVVLLTKKRNQLKYILSEIITINNNVLKLLEA
jgi:hypothetical protein